MIVLVVIIELSVVCYMTHVFFTGPCNVGREISIKLARTFTVQNKIKLQLLSK